MLICLVLCAAAVLPTAFLETPEAQNIQPHATRNNEMARRLAASYAAARNQGLLRLQKDEDQPSDVNDDATPFDIYTFLARNPSLLSGLEPESANELVRTYGLSTRSLDQIGGGHLLKRYDGLRALDPLGGGHLLKRDFQMRQLDSIGGGHLLKREALDSIGGGHLLKRYFLDPLGGGHLLKRGFEPRQLDAIGGGHLLKRTINEDAKELNLDAKYNEQTAMIKKNFDEIDNAGFKDYLYKRNFDEIDSAGFQDDFSKRNFDEIDNAGFQDYLYKRNFDEIDNAGFRDYLYKRSLLETYYPELRNEKALCTQEGCWFKKLVPTSVQKYQREP